MQGRRGRGKSLHWASCSNPSSPAASTGLCELGRWQRSGVGGGWCRDSTLPSFSFQRDRTQLPYPISMAKSSRLRPRLG